MCTSKWFHFISSIYLVGRWIKENWPRQRSHQRHKAAIEKIRWYLVKQVPAQGNRDSIVSILKCFLLAAELWLKPISDIAWVPFDLQEHKIHNKISLFMDFFYKFYMQFIFVTTATPGNGVILKCASISRSGSGN